MIRRAVDFALNRRLLVFVFAAVLLVGGGFVAFHNLSIDAYLDVADNYVEIITQWPGISAEQMRRAHAILTLILGICLIVSVLLARKTQGDLQQSELSANPFDTRIITYGKVV